MADVRVAPAFTLSDPGTPAQQAAVDASGRVSVSLTASSATVTVDTEMPAAAALADATANPTTTSVGALGLVWNGSNWDRQPGTTTGTFVQGNLAADSPLTARPLPGGGRASTAIPTAMSTDGDAVSLWLDRSGGTVVNGRDAHDAALDANTNPQLIGGRASAAAPTDVSADGDATRLWVLRSGAVASQIVASAGALITGDAANGLDVDVTRVSGTVTVDTEMPAAAALTSDAVSSPTAPAVAGFMFGYNGATWDRVRVANTGRLQVDVITGGGTDTPTNPVNGYSTSASLAAGSTSNADTSDFGAATKKVSQVILGASVPMKGELQFVDNGVATTLAVFFTAAGATETFKPPHRNYWSHTFSATAGFDGFRLIRTNLDPTDAADVYSNVMYED